MSNKGKEFEKDFKDSCDFQKLWNMRIHDTSLPWIQEKSAKYTPPNIADFLAFKEGKLYVVECKSTTYGSMSIQSEEDARLDKKKMIKYHQIKSLVEASLYDGVYAGFLLNFRNDLKPSDNVALWMDISDFCEFLKQKRKKSISMEDCVEFGGIVIDQKLKRVHFLYDISKMMDDAAERKKVIEKRINDFLNSGIDDLAGFFDDDSDDYDGGDDYEDDNGFT